MNENTIAQNDPYVVLPVQELNKIEECKQIDTFYRLDYNKAIVTIFTDGTATLFPGAGLGEGLLFYNVKIMQKMIDEKVFPIKNNGSFWEREKERILQLNRYFPFYCKKVSDFLGVEIKLSIEKDYLKKLSEIINQKFYNQKIKSDIYLYLAIYIGELIRIKNKGSRWVLSPQYALNIYYIPEIVNGENYCDPIWHVISRLEETSYMLIDVDSIICDVQFTPNNNRDYIEISP